MTATLWTTLADRFPALDVILKDAAPLNEAHARRVTALPLLAALAERAKADYGEAWSGGKIEASLRKVMDV